MSKKVSENAAYIAGDWGTSRFRLFLCDAAGAVLARAEGPGAAAGDHARVFAGLTAGWDAGLPAVLCGMVGSTIGWREVAYLDCPTPLDGLAAGALRFKAEGRAIALLPGLKCRNPLQNPDMLRGEETQLAGALLLSRERERHLFCLPGTHTKWVEVEDGAVTRFQTALSGELFDLLMHHSVLARGAGPVQMDDPAFAKGLVEAKGARHAGLLHALFGTRSRQLAGEFSREQAASYLSGLIIGDDVEGAAKLFDFNGPVTLIGAPALTALYGLALADYGVGVVDGEAAARAGLHSAWRSLFG